MSSEFRDAIEEALVSVHGPLMRRTVDTDALADAILAMPEMQAIRRALSVDADLHAVNAPAMTSARWLGEVVVLPQPVIDWVLGEEARRD